MTPTLGQKKFLVVDDFADMRSVLRGILRSLAVTDFDLAATGNEALALMRKRRPDIILCDYNLGEGKDGQQVLEEAREQGLIGVDTIYLMLTAENTREMVLAAVEYVPDSYLTKPFTSELLKTRLEKLIQQKAQLSGVNEALVAKDYAKALREINTLLVNEPRNRLELLKVKAQALISSNQLDQAQKVYQEILNDRDIRWARLGAGKVQFLKKDYTQAESTLRAIISDDRFMMQAYDLLVQTLMAQGRVEEAEKLLEQAVQISPRGLKRQIQLGNVALNSGNTQTAEKAFSRAVNLAKYSRYNHPLIHSGLAKSLTANGRHTEATKVVNEIERNFSGHEDAEFYQATADAMIKANQGNLKEAAAALAIAEKAMGDASGAEASELGLEMVKAYAKIGQKDKAEAMLQSSIANNHDDDAFIAQVKQVCKSAGMGDEGDKKIHKVQQDIIKVNNAGVRLIKQGEYDAAIKLLRRAADEMPGNKTVNLNVAKAIIMKMEQQGAQAEDIRLVRSYVEHVRAAAPDDWRLADISAHLQRLMSK
ncbi:tetratricopeptide repeat protein [Thiorhodovibrio frisius]|uniref:Response regulator containing CheY-like receiver domain and AraC-type DNA-binding domain n=1 Tax=Thiorhodovibrio frisius TaxID=631362 RepID=H8Z119_9GAMM|nr:tetratricopeptide repeat protein [Thiorhodovibrio frisius]EIC22440.1 response regulator containing CheY-like receiver domain and AraC-type DNA-binding domain [Thiorhodovibrio frisius]WPL24741.1 Chemotaxis protein CheY [Thiorhodovibrio frisius]